MLAATTPCGASAAVSGAKEESAGTVIEEDGCVAASTAGGATCCEALAKAAEIAGAAVTFEAAVDDCRLGPALCGE